MTVYSVLLDLVRLLLGSGTSWTSEAGNNLNNEKVVKFNRHIQDPGDTVSIAGSSEAGRFREVLLPAMGSSVDMLIDSVRVKVERSQNGLENRRYKFYINFIFCFRAI